MSELYYSAKLYPLQDKVLRLFTENNIRHYLTGGTALSRCFLHHRYSDDLDLFLNNDPEFETESDKAINLLKENFEHVSVDNRQQHFARIFIIRDDTRLKIDFVNDIGYHFNGFETTELYHKVDNPLNILSNKIAALERQAAKDIADLLMICNHYSFNWPSIINDALKKDSWVNEVDVLTAIKTFDGSAILTDVAWTQKPVPDTIRSMLKKICYDIATAANNSLFQAHH
jgi:predicted nucleotidyltransferase component of viral defense system